MANENSTTTKFDVNPTPEEYGVCADHNKPIVPLLPGQPPMCPECAATYGFGPYIAGSYPW